MSHHVSFVKFTPTTVRSSLLNAVEDTDIIYRNSAQYAHVAYAR